MLHEKSRRPPKLYIKLEEEKPFAITWLADTCKACKLFYSNSEREVWLKSLEALKLLADKVKLKKEDSYICKSKIGPIIDIDNNELVFDTYTMALNVAQLDSDLIRTNDESKVSRGRRKLAREKLSSMLAIKDSICKDNANVQDLARQARIIMDDIERLANDTYWNQQGDV